ncbi:hypothetical protein GQ44DRAFT_702120 [Phaeosphaeriaceae sp. PMI808]|nr:hypothetical protein GQ44DRAFT_702120 [Phaeosphaeriaceae sp. PMI808]
MANQHPSPANSNLTTNPATPLTTTSQPSAPYTPRSSSVQDDSDTEFIPTPLQSPRGGPDFDDLPPSYDEARHQAVSDARNGIAPLDPNQLEAHRLTLNEGPNEPEVWEYRMRGEELDTANEHEQAPAYDNSTNNHRSTVPIQQVQNSENIPVGRVGSRNSSSSIAPDPTAGLLTQALNFTRHEPDKDIQYAPRLTRRIAVPQQSASGIFPVQFCRVYAKALHTHSIRPAEFTEFIDGLNALCMAANMTVDSLLNNSPAEATSSIVYDYIRGANEAFFAPRGLRVSFQSLSVLIEALAIPTKRGQRAGAIATALDPTATVEMRAQALRPWSEAVDTNVPEQSTQSLVLSERAERLRTERNNKSAASVDKNEDPPHSDLDAVMDHGQASHSDGNRRGRGGHRGGPWSPFGVPGHGPFGAPGNGPFGAPGNGPFGPFGRPGRGPFGHQGPPQCGRSRGLNRSGRPGSSQSGNEWATLGENIGKWGEDFGKKMGDWGQQFGKQAEVWGQDMGKRAEVWGEGVSARASGSGSGSRGVPISRRAPSDDALPPSYEGPTSQESGVLREDSKSTQDPPKYEEDNLHKTDTKATKDDDASSVSSDSSDSDTDSDDSDDDDEDLPDTQAIFLKRIQSINKQAEASTERGKKSPEEIAKERALAIEKAEAEKTAMDLKIEEKLSKRGVRRDLKQKRRNLKREHRAKKRALKTTFVGNGKGKGKGKAKKSPEWREAKKEYREKKRELKKEKMAARKEWREARASRKTGGRVGEKRSVGQEMTGEHMVWVVVENLVD